MSRSCASRCFALALAAALTSTIAHADDKSTCVDAHASGQEHRLRGGWLAAAAKFRACAAPSCPRPIQLDCTRWEEELRRLQPTIVVAAQKPDGTDTVDTKLSIDGRHVADRLPATAIALDPGEHTIRLEHVGLAPVEQRFVVREREQDRRVTIRFEANAGSSAVAPPAPSDERSPLLGIVLVSVGAVALGVGGTFGILGRSRETELADSPCGANGTCSPDDVDVVRQRYWIAGIGAGVGIVALGLGIWQLVARPGSAKRSAWQPSVGLTF